MNQIGMARRHAVPGDGQGAALGVQAGDVAVHDAVLATDPALDAGADGEQLAHALGRLAGAQDVLLLARVARVEVPPGGGRG